MLPPPSCMFAILGTPGAMAGVPADGPLGVHRVAVPVVGVAYEREGWIRGGLGDVSADILHLAVGDEAGVGHRQSRGGDAEPGHEPHLEPRAFDERGGEGVVRARGVEDRFALQQLPQVGRRGVGRSR